MGALTRILLLVSTLSLVSYTSAQQVCLTDIILVVDHSGSIRDTNPPGEDNWEKVMDFLRSIVTALDIGEDSTRLGLVSYGNRGKVDFTLNTYYSSQELLEKGINQIVYKGGNTNTTGALRVARQEVMTVAAGDRPEVNNIVILITDGIPTREAPGLPAEAADVRQMARLIAVGVTDAVDRPLLESIISKPIDKTYFSVEDFDQLSVILDELISEACRTVAPPVTTTTTTTTTPMPTGPCANEGDIYFILDASGSIDQQNFDKVIAFTKSVVQELPIDNGRVRFGLVTFSDNANNQWNLNRYTLRTDVLAALDNVVYTRGRTNTAAALDYVRINGFSTGDRSTVPNIAVIVTDGGSNDKPATMKASYEFKKDGNHLVSIGIGGWTDEYELRTMASYPSDANYFKVSNFNSLPGIRQQLNDLICDNVNECNSGPCRNGGTCVNGIGMYVCLCRSGFAGRNCERSCRVNADVVFALDASGSIGAPNFELETEFARNLIFGLNINGGTRAALETFANNAEPQFYLNEYDNKMNILNALTLYYTRGTTNTAAAIQVMDDQMFSGQRGDSTNRPNVGLIVTDGRSNDPIQTWTRARTARANGISLLAVGVGNNIRPKELEAIASYPQSKNIFYANDFTALDGIVNNVLDAVCNNEDECSSNPCRNNGRCIDLINGYRCECRTGYSGINCERGCDGRYDITFILDNSGSIRNERWQHVLNLFIGIVDHFEVSQDKARFSAVKFSDDAELMFNFNQYSTKQDVQAAINATSFAGGRTHTSSALFMMQDQMMRSDRGDRSDVPNTVIVLTDGGSNMEKPLTVPAAIAARVKGTHNVVIGLGDDLNMLELYGIASQPIQRTVMMAQSFRDLPDLVDQIPQAICDDLNECDNNPCRNGGQCVNKLYRYYCDCQGDWTGYNCDRRCSRQMDVVFLLDFSGSVEVTYDIVMAFTREVVNGLPMQFGRTRVGITSFMDDAQVAFDLNEFQSKEEVLNAIAFGETGGRTNTPAALRMAYNDMLTSSAGDRGGVDNIVVVVSDGGSNIGRANMDNEIRRLQSSAEVFSVAITEFPDMNEMNSIATDPDNDHVIRLPNAGAVEQAANTLLDRLCQ